LLRVLAGKRLPLALDELLVRLFEQEHELVRLVFVLLELALGVVNLRLQVLKKRVLPGKAEVILVPAYGLADDLAGILSPTRNGGQREQERGHAAIDATR